MKTKKYIFAIQPLLITFSTFMYNWKANGVVNEIDWPTIAASGFALIKIISIAMDNTRTSLEKLFKKETKKVQKHFEKKLIALINSQKLIAYKNKREFTWAEVKTIIKKQTEKADWKALFKNQYVSYKNTQELTATLQYKMGYSGGKR